MPSERLLYIAQMSIERSSFRCEIPNGPFRERRVAFVREWAERLRQTQDLHMTVEESDESVSCYVTYSGTEPPRQIETMLEIATGERFTFFGSSDDASQSKP